MNTKSVLAVAVSLAGTALVAQSPKPFAPPIETKFNSESAKMFAAKVQPILTNRCADCHAHKDHASRFRLKAIDPDINDPQGAEVNLRAAAKWITPGTPHASPLLTYATTAHGKAKDPPLPNPHVAYTLLEVWVHWACAPEGSAMPAVIPPPPTERWSPVQQASATTPTTSAIQQTSGFATGVGVKAESVTPPTDPFDPATFNRSTQPTKK